MSVGGNTQMKKILALALISSILTASGLAQTPAATRIS